MATVRLNTNEICRIFKQHNGQYAFSMHKPCYILLLSRIVLQEVRSMRLAYLEIAKRHGLFVIRSYSMFIDSAGSCW